jgi:glycosyltransferase involved in cell wall biosynthesis
MGKEARLRPRVGIDMHVVDGKYQGSRTHVIELFARVIAASPEIDFFLFLAEPENLKLCRPEFLLPNAHRVQMPHANPLLRLVWQLPRMQTRYALDLLHTQYILPFPCFSAAAVTIHDLLFESHPEYFGAFFRWRSRLLMRLSARRADHVFTVSEYSKSEIVERYVVAPDKVTVIHNAADRTRFKPGDEGAFMLECRGLLSNGFLLTVGRIEPRKNHARLLRAYAALNGDVPPLVVVGQRDFGVSDLGVLVAELGIADRVLFIDDVTDDELPVLYRHARLFVYPAFAEGFGMPPLEAMASGVAVITADRTALPEVVGDCGLLIDPYDVPALSRAMQVLLDDEELRNRLGTRALERARTFEWDGAAHRVRERYLDIFSRSGTGARSV